jgi:uncharacterized membrane protein (DUF2068 family)
VTPRPSLADKPETGAHPVSGATPQARAIRAVAVFEGLKGLVVLLAAGGVLSLVHKDVYAIAAAFIAHTHLNPAARYPQIFLDAASHAHDRGLLLLALGAGTYGVLRLVEGYGLFFQRRWAEVLAAGSGAIYVPFELFGLARSPTWHGLAILVLNLAVVAIMVRALAARRPPTAQAGA